MFIVQDLDERNNFVIETTRSNKRVDVKESRKKDGTLLKIRIKEFFLLQNPQVYLQFKLIKTGLSAHSPLIILS